MEYRKYYNKTHLPIGSKNNRQTIPQKHTVGLSDAEYENLKKDLTYILTEHFSNTISHDKVYAVVNEFVQNNIHLLKISPEEIKSALLEYLEKNPIKVDVPDWAMQPNKPTYNVDEIVNAVNKYDVGNVKELSVGANTVEGINILYETKSEKADTYTKSEIDQKLATYPQRSEVFVAIDQLKNDINKELGKKADRATTYTKTEVDNIIHSAIGEALEGDY
jgi:hypothetical protein